MNENKFRSYMNRARLTGGDYAAGYVRGLRRHYHGAKFGSAAEHKNWMESTGHRQTEGEGYREGFAGKPPRQERAGNPGVIPGEIQQRRNITLSDRLAEKAERIGGNVSEGIRIALEAHEH